MRVLDLFCGAGGAAMGLHRAWPDAEIIGVDIVKQPRYPFTFVQGDAMTYPLDGFDFIWASPPCQAYTNARKIRRNKHPDLIGATRARLRSSSADWVIENVVGAPLRDPVTLCGSMFGLAVYRHRIFEADFRITHDGCLHLKQQIKMGRPVKDGDIIQVVGNFSNVDYARKAMGIDWMTRDELAQAIPPAYSEFIARQFSQVTT